MQYLLLIYRDEADEFEESSPEYAEIVAEYHTLLEKIRENGHYVGAEPLKPVATATTVRVRDNKTQLTDGPFAETKEQLAGYFLVDCPDLDQAIEYARQIPAAKNGSIEVRPLMIIPSPGEE